MIQHDPDLVADDGEVFMAAILRLGTEGEGWLFCSRSDCDAYGSELDMVEVPYGRGLRCPEHAKPAPPAPPEPGRPAVQLGLEVDVPVAIRLPRGLGIAYQHPLGEE